MPKVSVIIPTYNRERFIGEAVESVLRQSFHDYEVIVIDDGSTDNTRAVLQPYAKRIRYVFQKNAGVSAARNAGIKRATGEWVAFLDSDDEWTEDYLAVQMGHVRDFPEAVAHITNALHVFPDGEKGSHFSGIKIDHLFADKQCLQIERPFRFIIFPESYWFLQSTVMRRDVLLQTPLFNEDLSMAEDLDVISRVALRGPFTFNNRILVRICRRNESLISLANQKNKGRRGYEAFGKTYDAILHQERMSIRDELALARALSSNRRALGNLLIRQGRNREARGIFMKSLCAFPTMRGVIKYLATFLPSKLALQFVIEPNDATKEELAGTGSPADGPEKSSKPQINTDKHG